ncbi:MAG: hypothetical protein RL375_604 [Pseudomonadota bacterium]
MSSYQDLVAQKAELERRQAELDKQIAQALQAERAQVIAQVKALMNEHGITAAELESKPGRGKFAAKSGAAATETRKVAAKYRDPDSGAGWSGRGLKPKWLKAALESGRSIDEFSV